ncbi:peptidoglycan-binding protein [Cystobacter fuscus]|uniref:peptidoglycan-binding domain-containing protein n=1 Tax=Cystobacter fuscus TaxID=43 RepID=UPI002B304446|nr:peptidoglycan-binding protein [Cystobacter fuscus]
MRKTSRIALLALALCGCVEDRDQARQEATQKPVEVALDPEALLQKGAVKRIQEALARNDFREEWKEGVLDGPTSAALRRAQKAHRLPATGVPDARTMEALGLAPGDVFERLK